MVGEYGVIHQLKIGARANNRVIKAADYQTLVDADSLLTTAESNAKEIVAAAEEQVAQAVKKGLETGLNEAKVQMEQELLSAQIKASELLKKSETEMIQLVQSSIENILGDIDVTDAISRLIQKGISELREEKRLIIRVSPEAETELEGLIREQFSGITDHSMLEYFEIKPDQNLLADAYIIEGQHTVIKSSLSDQMERLKKIISIVMSD